MAVEDRESFLSRWSRRKLEAKENVPASPPALAPAAEQPAAAAQAPAVRATESGAPKPAAQRSAEYREFFDPQVDEKLRQAALKGLFGDPHFKVMDGLDTYIDDYSIADPLPAAMLRQLNQAKGLFLFDDEDKAADSGETGTSAAPAAAADAAALPNAPVAVASTLNPDGTTDPITVAPAPAPGDSKNS